MGDPPVQGGAGNSYFKRRASEICTIIISLLKVCRPAAGSSTAKLSHRAGSDAVDEIVADLLS